MVLSALIAQAEANDADEAGQAAFFGFIGIASALVFASKSLLRESQLIIETIDLGAAYGTAKSGVGIASMGVLKPELIFKSIVPVIMAGILGIYGLIIALLVFQKVIFQITKNSRI